MEPGAGPAGGRPVNMIAPLELTGLTKVFPTPSGPFVAVRNVNVRIQRSEFVCILGHSGCGKSTVLSIIAGLQQATEGGVVINGKQTIAPGSDRAVVFQSPSLLPWLSARDNVMLAVGTKFPQLNRRERTAHADRYLTLVGVLESRDQMPAELSLGTQQCVSLARALALEPELLLLDERRRRGALPGRPPRAHDRRSRSACGRRTHTPVRAAARASRRPRTR
jgi:ABC-type nitrate/sulfonate/bicarbonate transport system ATPase subunit